MATNTLTELATAALDHVIGGVTQAKTQQFLRKAYAGELDGQMLLQQSGLGQPTGRSLGDFTHGLVV